MFDSLDFVGGRQVEFQAISPSGGVFFIPVATTDAVAQNDFESVPQPCSGFGLGCPDRPQYLEDVVAGNVGDVLRADDGEGVGLNGGIPLSGVFFVFPSGYFGLGDDGFLIDRAKGSDVRIGGG